LTEFKPIRRLAIANRGEAAMRCIRAVKSLGALESSGIQVIALYTDVDRAAPFVRHADVAVRLPTNGGTAVSAYLNHDLLISVLTRAGADAVWPGWGFVSEDPKFVRRVLEAGMRFLGPPPDVMQQLGDKISSKHLAERADVPVSPWSRGVVADEAEAKLHGKAIGYPLLIKASAGGGGRGIRIVRKEEDLGELFRSAAAEARGAFGDDRLFMEKMVQGGRHIEVQIVADQHGTVVALGCRDCSVQRRHQKVLEEAPPSGLPPLMIRALKESAAGLARTAGYVGAGTVEFLVQGADYFFLEMNPRLQVEHGITEEITGTDLVQLQIRIGRGEHLPPLDLVERGFSIEARVCAEDPDAGFLPAPGRIARFDPAFGPRLRIDTGVAPGSSVPSDFDSLIAKVIASGDTREEARARLVCALRDFDLVIEGGSTNKSFLLELLETDAYRAAETDTGWLDRWNEKRVPPRQYAAEALVLAAILSYQKTRESLRTNFFSDPGNITHDRIPPSVGMDIDLSYQGQQARVHVFASGSSQYRVHLDDRAVAAQLSVSGSHAARLSIAGQHLRVLYDISDVSIRVEVEGRVHKFGRQTAGRVTAATPSMVVAIHVREGQRVEAGQTLGLLEAMKMEISFDAPISGTVVEVSARRGQQVRAGEVLLVIDPASEDGSEKEAQQAKLRLPDERDPLTVLFVDDDRNPLTVPDLVRASQADPERVDAAVFAVRDEVRRVLLGYDAFGQRVDSLIALLEAPLPRDLGKDFLHKLALVSHELVIFADLERLFTRRQSLSEQGELLPSNNAQLRTFVRRMRAAGSGLDETFLAKIEAALTHYGISELEYSDLLEIAILRMFAAQATPELRFRLAGAVLQRVLSLVDLGLDFRGEAGLEAALTRIASLRGQVPDSVSDAALSATYRIFQRPELERAAERTIAQLETWLAGAERSPAPPDALLHEISRAPRRRFLEIEGWLTSESGAKRGIALAAIVRRLYVPRLPSNSSANREGGESLRLELSDGDVVLARVSTRENAEADARALLEQARAERRPRIELLVSSASAEQRSANRSHVIEAVQAALSGVSVSGLRFTLSLLAPGEAALHETWQSAPRNEGGPRPLELWGMHPEAAQRVDLSRYQSFHLERLNATDDFYCFYGKSRDLPDDERIFVLADVLERPAQDAADTALYIPIFERAFHEAARTLRVLLSTRDPGRRLQWNRVVLFLANPMLLDRRTAQSLAQRLHPATRHLGLERVTVRMRVIDPARPKHPSEVELIVSDLSGAGIDVTWREPHRAPLVPVSEYVRRVVNAKRRGLIYPYEIIRTLAVAEDQTSQRVGRNGGASPVLPRGSFAEYDLSLDADPPRAVSVAGREPGKNATSVVFGIISTPTAKVPEGMRRVLILSDPTREMGALAAPECDRIVAAIDLAEKLSLPVEWLPVSSGARIAMDSGTENLDATARVVRRIVTFTQNNGVIHMIIAGVNVGAQSYWDSLATMLLHTRGVLIMTPRASMVLTGRAALLASGSVAAEDETSIGGYERVMGPNGQAQYFASDLGEAYRILYEHYSYTYVVPGEARPRPLASTDPIDRNVLEHPYRGEGFEKIGELFSDATNPGRKKPFAMRSLMAAVIDQDGGCQERWQSQTAAETAIVWDAHLGGHPVCLLGIESQNVPRWGYRPLDGPADWNGGTLFPMSSKKIARALNAASKNRAAVILANLSGFDGSPESMRKLQLEYGAEIARAVVNFEGPLVFLVVSRYHGGAYVVFSRELNPSLRAFALEGSYASVIGGGPAAAVVFTREVRARVAKDPRIQGRPAARTPAERIAREKALDLVKLEKQAELAQEFDSVHTVERAREVGSLEAIFPARQLRQRLIEALGTPAA
jgi:acetyl/propionyl-CoA carboxylase alpha subunit/acetyl-CoA carboxylase carboxyltransferase component